MEKTFQEFLVEMLSEEDNAVTVINFIDGESI